MLTESVQPHRMRPIVNCFKKIFLILKQSEGVIRLWDDLYLQLSTGTQLTQLISEDRMNVIQSRISFGTDKKQANALVSRYV